MSLEIEGVLIKKFDTQQVSASFQKREFVLETQEQYPQQIKLELTQDKCTLLDPFNEGEKMKASFNLKGREWQGKYFVNLQAWRLDKAGASTGNSNSSGPGYDNFPPPAEEPHNENPYSDDLPF